MEPKRRDNLKGEPFPADATLARLVARLLEQPTVEAASDIVASRIFSRAQRRQLAVLAGLEGQWCHCDQRVASNVRDLAGALAAELWEPFWFYQGSRTGLGESDKQPRALFARQLATPPLKHSSKYWQAQGGVIRHDWLPGLAEEGSTENATFDAVAHFVQPGSGTGVHVGGGRVLTCAHVVDARDDDGLEEGQIPERVGRKKLVVFASGRTFLAECLAAHETADGAKDVALMSLKAEVVVNSLPKPRKARPEPPAAVVAEDCVALFGRLFCVGNPSRVDLESFREGATMFEPPIWHTSVGRCEGYLDPKDHLARAKRVRGRALTRGELKYVMDAEPVGAQSASLVLHSCWTYWGHSGAPLFDENGKVVGLHCAWDDATGMRHAQGLHNLFEVISMAEAAASFDPSGHAQYTGHNAGGKTVQQEKTARCSKTRRLR